MKEMITAISSLFILSIFVLQFAVNQNLAVKTAISGAECYRLAEEAGGDGKNYEETVKCRMADIWQCDKDEVFALTTGMADGGGMSYRVSLPVKNVIACGQLLGLPEKENIWIYETEGIVG